jgi:tellurite resistance protein
MLRVGVALASADGRVEVDELAVLSQQLHSMFELSPAESRRLDVARAIIGACDVADAARALRKLDLSRRPLVVPLILAIVAADGIVSAGELKATRRLFAAIGLERDAADVALAPLMPAATVASDDDGPVVVAAAVAGRSGEPIPPAVEMKLTVTLDRAAITAILRDTHEVARLLADAMDVEGDEEPAPPKPLLSESPIAVLHPSQLDRPTAVAELPARYAAFYEQLLTRPSWSRADLVALAAESKLMASGAVEAVNEWSTDAHGGPIVYEDGDAFVLEQGYLN